MKLITAYEYGRVEVSENGSSERTDLTPQEYEAFCSKENQLPRGAVSFHRNSLVLSNFCGLVQVGAVALEILPKIYREGGTAAEHRTLLLEMLSVCYDLKLNNVGGAGVGLSSKHLLHVFIHAFCDELARQLRSGVIRTYIGRQENLQLIRGRINFGRQILDNFAHHERVACDYEELSHDNTYNQIIACTIRRLRGLVRGDAGLSQRIQGLSLYFEGVSLEEFDGADARALPINRLVERFGVVMRWCEWFLDCLSPEVFSGENLVFSLLFDMNELFQSYAYRVIRYAAQRQGHAPSLLVLAEAPQRCLVRMAAGPFIGRPYFTLKPDLTVSCMASGEMLAIIDTKWKRLDPTHRWGYWGISSADVYQMLAYSQSYGCNSVTLLYPDHAGLTGYAQPTFHFELARQEFVSVLRVRTIRFDTIAPRGLRANVIRQSEMLLSEIVVR
jgi:5-methylcytosine-specific restriction enzyme subunit McrC